ncbi:IS110 family transposase [Streptomyces sp. NPDC051976]|uniref:IS110 family transposase n=1 Tax=Streptomyces sp. NPDC051976 TaxID=3154947 RepID=UPI003427540B
MPLAGRGEFGLIVGRDTGHLPGVARLLTDGLNKRVRGLETTIRELVTPLAPALLEITGISHVSAAVLLAEIGDITRFTSSAKLARYTGTAPIPVYSSDKERYRLHRGGNRRLNTVLYTTSIVQQRFHPGARALLALGGSRLSRTRIEMASPVSASAFRHGRTERPAT